MRQLGDFAAWLVMILVILGAVYYTPRLLEYMNDDSAERPLPYGAVARSSEWPSPRRNMAMRHGRFDHRANEGVTAN